jgi:hypothetical protein
MAADPLRRPPVLGELLVVLGLVVVYDRVRDVATTRADLAVRNAAHILSWESGAGIDLEHRLNAALAGHQPLQSAAAWYYQLAHLSVTLTVLLWCYWRRPALYRASRNALVLINAAALAVFWLYPVAPPRLLPGAGFVDSAVVSGVAERATTVSPDLYAAMPSLHLAWATWVALLVVRATSNRVARALAYLHVVLTSVVVMATANHYVLDLAAGCLLAVAATYLTAMRISGGMLVAAELPGAAAAGRARTLARQRLAPQPSGRAGMGQGNEENHVR